jgi:putative hemolysin
VDLYINEFQPTLSIPVLIKKYLRMNGKIIGFNIDPNFSNCLDGLMLVDISDIPFAMLDNLAKEMEDSQVKERFKPVLIMHSIVQENVCQC